MEEITMNGTVHIGRSEICFDELQDRISKHETLIKETMEGRLHIIPADYSGLILEHAIHDQYKVKASTPILNILLVLPNGNPNKIRYSQSLEKLHAGSGPGGIYSEPKALDSISFSGSIMPPHVDVGLPYATFYREFQKMRGHIKRLDDYFTDCWWAPDIGELSIYHGGLSQEGVFPFRYSLKAPASLLFRD